MTLIIASATPHAQIVMADRQLTRSDGKVRKDSAYKIFVYANLTQAYEFAVAYTGLGELRTRGGSVHTIDWLMRALPRVMDRDTDVGAGISAFTAECTEKFSSLNVPLSNKPTTFVFCGRYNRFGRDTTNLQYIPFVAVISNCANHAGAQTNTVSTTFEAYSSRLFRLSSSITLCRGDLSSASHYANEFKQLCRFLRKPIPHNAKIKFVVDYIRLVASRSDLVGTDVLGVAMRTPHLSEGYDFSTSESQVERTMPHFVTDDGSIATNITVRSGG